MHIPSAMRRATRSARLLAAPAVVALAALSLLAPAALAAAPPRLSGAVTDQTGELSSSDKARIVAATDALARDANVQLFTVFVDSTSPLVMADFANQTASLNGLGARDALIAVALGDQTYHLWYLEDSIPLTTSQVDSLLVDRLEPGLRAGDYAGAIVALADGMAADLAGTAPGTAAPASAVATAAPATSAPAEGGSSGSKGFSVVTLVAIVVVVGLIAGIWLMLTRKRNKEIKALRSTLSSNANEALVLSDDMIRDMEQDVAFAQAEFGDEAAAPFAAAVVQAKAEMAEAFKVRQKLDDDVPEDDATREKMTREIIGRCARAKEIVDAQRAAIENLRELEKKAPEILDGLPPQEAQLEARIASATALYERLGTAYADSVRQPIAGNIEEAQKRLDIVSIAVDKGKEALTGGDTRTGTQLAVASQVALQQAGDLLGAIERTAASADDAAAKVPGILAEVDADVASAKAAIGAPGGPTRLAPSIAQVEAQVAGIRAAMAQPRPDVLTAYAQAVAAAQASDQVLAGIRSEAERVAREKATLGQTISAAELQYRRAADYIAARRSGVDREARTRLSEAERHLAAAQVLAAQDVSRALQEARLADSLAAQALQLASDDFDRYDRGGPTAPPSRGGGGIDVGSILVGAALGGMLSGGGGGSHGSGGGFGGTPWGGGGGFGGGSGGAAPGGHGRGGRW